MFSLRIIRHGHRILKHDCYYIRTIAGLSRVYAHPKTSYFLRQEVWQQYAHCISICALQIKPT